MKKLVVSITSFAFALALLTLQVGYGIAKMNMDGNVQAAGTTLANESDGGEPSAAILPSTSSPAIETREFKSGDFVIEIPSIGLSKEVTPNVDPRSKDVYGPVIEKTVAHGMFTKLPDETDSDGRGNVYLFAHRDGPAAFFARLGELDKGDKIYLQFLGATYTYQVYDSFIVLPTDTYVYTGESSEPTLTLQTCNNGVKERLIVKARLIS